MSQLPIIYLLMFSKGYFEETINHRITQFNRMIVPLFSSLFLLPLLEKFSFLVP
jgi:hypothetical protein